jgi:hypothetical protein
MRRPFRNQASLGRPNTDQASLGRRASIEAAKIYISAGALYEEASRSDSVFGSPLGPIEGPTGKTFLPQFVYFGPGSSVDPVRIAVFSGLGGDDIKGSWSLIEWVKSLLVRPDIGQGVSVSVFPVVNLLGIRGGAERPRLQYSDWSGSQVPEIRLIAENARIRSYQGFIRIEASRDSVPRVVVRTALKRSAHHSPAEVYASSDFEPWDTHFETLGPESKLLGPLSLSRELKTTLFEVVLSVPSAWRQSKWNLNLLPLLERLVASYRRFFSYGGEL